MTPNLEGVGTQLLSTERRCDPFAVVGNSFRATQGSLILSAVLLLSGILLSDVSTPPEVVYADAFFVVTSLAVLSTLWWRRRGLVAALALGLLLVLRSVGDPDLMALFEGGGPGLVQDATLLLFVASSLVLLLSSYGTVILRRSGVLGESP